MEKKTHVIIASLILSILVWLSVSMNNQYSIGIRVPFRVSNLPDGIALANPIPSSILVRVRGTGWQLASAYLSTTSSVNFDLSTFDRRRILLTSRELGYSLDLGSSAEVLGFTPDTVMITLDGVINKQVPVTPKLIVEPREGFTIVGEPELSPDSVQISGAKKLVETINSWPTQTKKYKKVMNGIDVTLPLSDTLKGIVALNTTTVNVKIDIEQIADNTYSNIPVTILNNLDSASVLLLPPTVNVTVRGGINTMTDMTPDSFRVTVDYNELLHSSSSYTRPNVVTPLDLQIISIQPDSVEFVIRK